jgi:radical SAM superfamily enzyme YgiQ (UPF0313 family)
LKIAAIATYVHPTRLRVREHSAMQCAVPELIAALCPESADVEIYNEKERDIPLDRDWDLVFFSYLHSYYEHTKTLSTLLRARGIKTVAGGRHAGHFPRDASKWFDAVVIGEPEPNVPRVVRDFERGELKAVYAEPSPPVFRPPPFRHELVDMKTNVVRLSGVEASRGCPFRCNFCVLTGHEQYRFRPVDDVVSEIRDRLQWNKNLFGVVDDSFVFLDNNLGGSTKFLRELCTALVPLRKYWGCAVTFNVLQNEELVRLMARAGCRYVYTGLESLNPASLGSMDKKQNRLSDVARVVDHTFRAGIVMSIGLILGADGDTNEYLSRVPEYLAELDFSSVTYVGLVCPYPETPFFRKLAAERRLLPGIISRDLDGYTLCHRPTTIAPDEVVEHYKNLSRALARPSMVIRHALGRAFASARPRFHTTLAVTAREVASMTHPLENRARTFLAGGDAIEAWDAQQMLRLGIPVQRIDETVLETEQERRVLPMAAS